MPRTPKQMVKLLLKNGFIKLRQDGTSHALFYNESNNRKVVVPMHNGDLKKGTELRILKDAGLDP